MSAWLELQIAGPEGLVVASALRRVAKDRIGLVDDARTFGGLYARVRVRMIAPHQRVIGSADYHILGCGGHAQNGIMIFLHGVRRQPPTLLVQLVARWAINAIPSVPESGASSNGACKREPAVLLSKQETGYAGLEIGEIVATVTPTLHIRPGMLHPRCAGNFKTGRTVYVQGCSEARA